MGVNCSNNSTFIMRKVFCVGHVVQLLKRNTLNWKYIEAITHKSIIKKQAKIITGNM